MKFFFSFLGNRKVRNGPEIVDNLSPIRDAQLIRVAKLLVNQYGCYLHGYHGQKEKREQDLRILVKDRFLDKFKLPSTIYHLFYHHMTTLLINRLDLLVDL